MINSWLSAKSASRRTVFVLIGVSLVTLLAGGMTGRLHPQLTPDSAGYLQFDWQQPLASPRTIGYPAFLWCLSWFGDVTTLLPFAHWLALTLAVLVFHGGLQNAGYKPGTALACSVPLLLGRGWWDLGAMVLADSLAISVMIAACGCFLATQGQQACRVGWIGCGVLTFAAYQIRPAMLFLIVLWPTHAFFFDQAKMIGWTNLRRRVSLAMIWCGVGFLPLVAFSSFRYLSVGHWGLTSFGGYNIIGISGQFLDESVISQLQPKNQLLAKRIVRSRTEMDGYLRPTSLENMESNFNPTVWGLAVPAATELYGEDTIAINQHLSDLARETIRLRPRDYVRWLIWNTNHARKQLIQLTAFDKGWMLALLLSIGWHLRSLWHNSRSDLSSALVQPDSRTLHVERHLLPWFAAQLALLQAVLVVLVEPANDRYMTPAMVLLPAVMSLIFAQWVKQTGRHDID